MARLSSPLLVLIMLALSSAEDASSAAGHHEGSEVCDGAEVCPAPQLSSVQGNAFVQQQITMMRAGSRTKKDNSPPVCTTEVDQKPFCERGWVKKSCSKGWAQRRCPRLCSVCVPPPCMTGDWSVWQSSSGETCSSACGSAGQTRSRQGCDQDGAEAEERQCKCSSDACPLTISGPISLSGSADNNKVIENKIIITTGQAPAIFIQDSTHVSIRNVVIVHSGAKGYFNSGALDQRKSGIGIKFENSPNLLIENVKVQLQRDPNPNANRAAHGCDAKTCGPFSADMKYAYNIGGQTSPGFRLNNVHVTGGSSGFHCDECPDGRISNFKVENVHGPFPRGQCLQVISSPNFVLEDFYCYNDNEVAFTEDTISIWKSPNSVVQRGVIDGGNAPRGVGLMFEMSDHSICSDVDVTNNGQGAFSAYGAKNVTFLRTRARDNHGPNGDCMQGHGYCTDPDGYQTVGKQAWDCNETDTRGDPGGGIWYAGDYDSHMGGGSHVGYNAAEISIQQGVFYNMYSIDLDSWSKTSISATSTCELVDMTSWRVAAASRQEAYIQKDMKMEAFTVKTGYDPSFCWAS